MTLTLTVTSRVPGKSLKVDGKATGELADLDAKADKGEFLVGAIEKLKERVLQEVETKSKQADTPPSHD